MVAENDVVMWQILLAPLRWLPFLPSSCSAGPFGPAAPWTADANFADSLAPRQRLHDDHKERQTSQACCAHVRKAAFPTQTQIITRFMCSVVEDHISFFEGGVKELILY